MRRTRWLLGWVVCALALGACTEGDGLGEGTGEVRLLLRDGRTLEGPECGFEGPRCPAPLSCSTVDLDTGRRTLCVDERTVCDALSCPSGKCALLESYPMQVKCVR
ncbi:hypothetical protein P2318_00395 [Myxococcaceae bacterium GXIMD 01537]